MDRNNTISLKDLSVNHQAIVSALHIGTAEATRLVSLGLTPGARVSMSQNYGWGPLIVTVRGTHVALGRMEAAKILVSRSAG